MIYLDGIGVWGPGMTGWPGCRARLAEPGTSGDYAEPPAAALPPRERRRSLASVRLAVEVAGQACAGRDPAGLATVFSSSGGDLATLNAICTTLAGDARLLSPTRFHNSVHNAPGGYWGIVSGCQRASTSIAAGPGSFAFGLLETAAQCTVEQTPVMLVAYDLPGPAPLAEHCRVEVGFGVALAFSPAAVKGAPGLEVRYDGAAAETVMSDAGLEGLRRGNPAARCLPLLAAVAAGGAGTVVLNAGAGSVSVEIGGID